ncbi:hypothetical protein [Azospirillum brasilense]|uniref:hypothetical protein n=1 Tax=Azospirillum brasilense TaxID=192 RepID=UPI001557BD38|nr:hypothetical protein [Azospirillum brasilense]
MGQIKHPGGSGSVTPQTEGSRRHVRGTQAKSYDKAEKAKQERAEPPIADKAADRPTEPEVQGGRRDTDANPGIGSSPGTFGSGQPGIDDNDR